MSENGNGPVAEANVIIPPDRFEGHWSNSVQVARGEHEVTIDFYRVGPGGQQAILVSRIDCSTQLADKLLQALQPIDA